MEEEKKEEVKETKPESASQGQKPDTGIAVLAHILGIIIGFIGPLIIYLMQQQEGFVKNQAKEALNFQLTLLIAWVGAWILSFVLIGMIFFPIIWIINLIFCIIAAMAASKGQEYHYPMTVRFIK